MKIVTNIYHHSKGKVTELAFVGNHPIESKYMIFMEVKLVEGKYKTVEVLRDDLSTPFMYSNVKEDVDKKAVEWLKNEQYLLTNGLK